MTRPGLLADGGGVLAAILAALCCAGTPWIVAGLAALGLGALRRDAILWPLMLVSLLIAVWGFWQGTRTHRRFAPLWLGGASAVALAAGVIVVHGPPAMALIYAGAAGLVAAMVWNVRARRACVVRRTALGS